ncbi:MAG TPA: class I SAM-dependent methyltransferase [Candidatus Binatia bacterium]|nr:class I SAM-dependent methyltransferase [Candidatus Binatia bacterium]
MPTKLNDEPSSWIKQQKEYYQTFPHAHLQFHPESVYAENIADEVLKHTGLSAGKKLLEVGCGSGRFTLHLIRKGLSLTALDLSAEQLDNLRQASRQFGLKTDPLVVQTGDLSTAAELFKGQEFDGIIGFFILHHLEDIRSGLQSLRQILRNGGAMIFIEPNRLNPLFLAQLFFCKDMTWRGEKGTFRHGVSGYRRCFEDSGYTEIGVEKFGFFPPQILDKFPLMLRIEKWLEKVPFVKIFLPFLLITAKKTLQTGA